MRVFILVLSLLALPTTTYAMTRSDAQRCVDQMVENVAEGESFGALIDRYFDKQLAAQNISEVTSQHDAIIRHIHELFENNRTDRRIDADTIKAAGGSRPWTNRSGTISGFEYWGRYYYEMNQAEKDGRTDRQRQAFGIRLTPACVVFDIADGNFWLSRALR